jgi:hypothetical protein
MFIKKILLDESTEVEVEYDYKPGLPVNFRGLPDRWFPREEMELDILNVFPAQLEPLFNEIYKLSRHDIEKQLIEAAEQEIESWKVEQELNCKPIFIYLVNNLSA